LIIPDEAHNVLAPTYEEVINQLKDRHQKQKKKLDKKFYNQLEELWKNDDAKYDEETNHGNIKEMQIKWDDRFSKLRN